MTRLMVFGAGGRAGRQITQEAARRGAGPVGRVVFVPPMELVEDEGTGAYRIRNLGGPLSYTALANALLDAVAAERHHRVQVGLSGD